MELRARDIMNSDVIAVSASMDLRDLAKMFLEKGITGAPVVDDDGGLGSDTVAMTPIITNTQIPEMTTSA